MKIGITYDLREDYVRLGFSAEETAEFEAPETIEAIDQTLRSFGHSTDRIGGIRDLTLRLAAGDRWDMVFNIAEGLRGFGRESQVPALLDAYEIPYTFSDPLVLAVALHKGMTKHALRSMGIATPDFAVVESESDIGKVDLPFPVFAKPVAEGSSKGISPASRIVTQAELAAACRRLLADFRQAVLVERFLPGREFTVGILGTGRNARAIGVMEVMFVEGADSDLYTYSNKQRYETCVRYRCVSDRSAQDAVDLSLRAWRGLGCRDAGRIDIRCDQSGAPAVLELNPLAGIHPAHSDLVILSRMVGLPYRSLIQAIVTSASERLPP